MANQGNKIVSSTVVEKAPSEIISRFFDFTNYPEILAGATLNGTPVTVVVGTANTLTLTLPTISGSKVTVLLTAGFAATQESSGLWVTEYTVRCTVTTDGSHTLVMEGTLRVESSDQVNA